MLIHSNNWFVISLLLLFMALVSCSRNNELPGSISGCPENDIPVVSAEALSDSLGTELIRINRDVVLEAIVLSSDEEGNFYREIYLMDGSGEGPGIVLHTDLIESHKIYPVGTRIRILLKGTHARIKDGLIHVGGMQEYFGNPSLGPIPSTLLDKHIPSGCLDYGQEPDPQVIGMDQVGVAAPGTLLRLDSVQFSTESIGLAFALPEEDKLHLLEDCKGNRLEFYASGYSEFQPVLIPEGRGSVMGILRFDGGTPQIVIRGLGDLVLNGDRCTEPSPIPVAQDSLLITEVADPDNLPEARFVEIQNSSVSEVRLDGWVLERYTNASTQVSSVFPLDGLVLQAGDFLLIARDSITFKDVYGFSPAVEAGRNSVADSNGDDNLVLRDPQGNLVDILGRIGEDGSGTDHEFEDGRAFRLPGINRPSAVFTPDEWDFWNDTGEAGTTGTPQNAPDDYSPGSRGQ